MFSQLNFVICDVKEETMAGNIYGERILPLGSEEIGDVN